MADPLQIPLPSSPTAANSVPSSPTRSKRSASESDEVVCKVCRGGPEEGVLFSPCKCKGSIQHVHQDCLFQWLQSRKGKEACELCHTNYRFFKRYADDVPQRLPFFLLLKRIVLSVSWLVLLVARILLVLFCWIALLPWITFWTFRFLIYSGTSISAGLTVFSKEELSRFQSPSVNATAVQVLSNVTSLAVDDPWKRAIYNAAVSLPVKGSDEWKFIENALSNITTNSIFNAAIVAKWNIQPPMTIDQLLERVYYKSSFNRWLRIKQIASALGRDCFSGQIITCLVVVAFISIFLLREWIGQHGEELPEVRPVAEVPPVLIPAPIGPPPPSFTVNPDELGMPVAEFKESVWEQITIHSGGRMTRDNFDRMFDTWAAASQERDRLNTETLSVRDAAITDSDLKVLQDVLIASQKAEDTHSDGSLRPKEDVEADLPIEDRPVRPLPRRINSRSVPTALPVSGPSGGKAALPDPPSNESAAVLQRLAEDFRAAEAREEADMESLDQEWDEAEETRLEELQALAFSNPVTLEMMRKGYVRAGSRNAVLVPLPDSEDEDEEVGQLQRLPGADKQKVHIKQPPSIELGPGKEEEGDSDAAPLAWLVGADGMPPLDIVDDSSDAGDLDWEDEEEHIDSEDEGDDQEEDEDDLLIMGGADDEMPLLPEGVDEAGFDDLEGIFEAIGLRGNLIVLFQTVALMDLLIAFSLSVLVWLPLMLGRITILGRLPYHLLTGPVKLVRFVTDPLVDFASYAVRAMLSRMNLSTANSLSTSLSQNLQNNTTEVATSLSSFSEANFASSLLNRYQHLSPLSKSSIEAFAMAAEERWYRFGKAEKSLDRVGCIAVGYMVALLLALAWYAREKNADRPISRTLRRLLRQQGIVMKVASYILIELVVFPAVCGLAINISTISLFPGSSITSRLHYFQRAPYSGLFVTWTSGTVFMFLVAQCIRKLRVYLRKGSLFFIRDPRDPDAHPVAEMVATPIRKQTIKLAKSVLLYGSLVAIYALFAFGTASLPLSILPLHWDLNAALSAAPFDLIFAFVVIPWTVEAALPGSQARRWTVRYIKLLAHQFRLSSYLLGVRVPSEEGTYQRQTWQTVLRLQGSLPARLNCAQSGRESSGSPVSSTSNDPIWVPSGTLARVPAVDSVKLPPGRPSTIAVNDDHTAKDVQGEIIIKLQNMLGGGESDWQYVYLPPRFRIRLMSCLYLIWVSISAIFAIGCVLPLIFGRFMLALLLDHPLHDGYAFLIGAHVLYPLCWAVCRGFQGLSKRSRVRRSTKKNSSLKTRLRNPLHRCKKWIADKQILKWASVLTSLAFETLCVVPLLTGIGLRMYLTAIWQSLLGRTTHAEEPDTIWLPLVWCYGFVVATILIAGALLGPPPARPGPEPGIVTEILIVFDEEPAPETSSVDRVRLLESTFVRPICITLAIIVATPIIATQLGLFIVRHYSLDKVAPFVRLDLSCLISLLVIERRVIKSLLSAGYQRWLQNVKDAEYMVERKLLNYDAEVDELVAKDRTLAI